MDAPKCRLCGSRHWLNQDCDLKPDRARLDVITPSVAVSSPPDGSGAPSRSDSGSNWVEVSRLDNPPRKVVSLAAKETDKEKGQGDSSERRPKFDRNDYHRNYMREYMRRKRAEDKSK